MDKTEYENKSHGGKRDGAGRKPKADEAALIERLSPMSDLAFAELEKGIANGDFQFIKLFFEYSYGKPKDKIDVTSNGQTISAIKLVDVDGTEF